MGKQLIIYGSRYGSAKRYAERLAQMTGLEAVEYKEVKALGDYDRIVYLGSLYAGGVTGLKQTVGKMTPQQELIVATVGLADPTDAANVAHIRQSVKGQVPAYLYDESRIFHLRGAIDYTKLNLKYRLMMSLLAKKVAKTARRAAERRNQGDARDLRQAGGFRGLQYVATDCGEN